MKLQVAIDRVSLEKAENLIEIFDGLADVIEVGTSLVKDYGLLKLKGLTNKKMKSQILGDIKASDEGAYEFKQDFKQCFDILTVMGSASLIANEGRDFNEVIKEITEIIAASVRNPIHVIQAAQAGAHIATVPHNLIIQMLKHPLTDQGLEKFKVDWAAAFGK
jgi:3-keto-L-gulonate-6-phosphate decarboxylase